MAGNRPKSHDFVYEIGSTEIIFLKPVTFCTRIDISIVKAKGTQQTIKPKRFVAALDHRREGRLGWSQPIQDDS